MILRFESADSLQPDLIEGLMNRFRMAPGKYLLFFVVFAFCPGLQAHDVITTKLTWNGEISRIVYARCGACHRQGGTSFSLMRYEEARPWAKAIEEEVLERRMPPWGAVKGFGSFRNDQALTQEQLELITNWVDGGAPEGNPNDLPPLPKYYPASDFVHLAEEIVVSGDYKVQRKFILDGLLPKAISNSASLQVTAELPDGTIEPLVWLRNYKTQFGHPFLLRRPLALPVGSLIRGVPPGSSMILLPAESRRSRNHQTTR
jgi:hypothetical protein